MDRETQTLAPAALQSRMMRIVSALVVLSCAVAVVTPISLRSTVISDRPIVDLFAFYGVTCGGYGLLPFVRRGDVAMVAMWVVLGVGVAPCFTGQELSPEHMFGGMAGVLMAAGPVYIARFRQIAQGDIRLYRRRETEDGA